MVRVPLSDDYTLLLSPRWPDLGPAGQAAALALLGLAPLVIVLALYRRELRLLRRLAALVLLGLRLAVVALLWLLVALQPVVACSTTEELPGRVLVVVDRSASMDVADPGRSVLEKLRLARALKLGAAEGRPPAALLNAWIHHYEDNGTRAPPRWLSDGEATAGAARRRQLARQRQSWHDQLCRQVDKLTRTDAARLLLTAEGRGLLPALRSRHVVELMGFHQEAWDVAPGRASDLFRPAGRARKGPGRGLYLGPGCTDLGQPLARALARSGPDRGRILGVVLLSDGQHNWGPSPAPKAAELGQRKIPVFPVLLGTTTPPPDVVLTEVRARANVFRDTQAPVEARFTVTGMPAQDVKVELHRPGRKLRPEDVRTVRHDGTDRSYTVHFRPLMSRAGTEVLTVKVRPTSDRVKETTTANNSRRALVRVASDRIRVLLIDGEARWEYHYLAAALLRDRAVRPDRVVFKQPRLGEIPQAELARAGLPGLRLPEKKAGDPEDPLARYDCIILGDVAPEQLPVADRLRLERYVAGRGGTLVLVAGKRHLPLGFGEERGPRGEPDPLLKLLPVEAPEAVRPTAGFAVRLTPEGSAAPFMQMDPTPDASVRVWAGLPRHYWAAVGRARPGATVLAFVPAEGGKGPGGGAERARALIARQNYGAGRVLYVGLDSTWRWRYRTGDRYHHRFWGQVVRWAAADDLLPAGNRHVRFGSRDPVYGPGGDVEVLARLSEEVGPLPPGAQASARLLRRAGGKEEPAAVVRLEPAPARPRLLRGKVRGLAPGRYRIELDIPHLGAKLKAPPEDPGAGREGDGFTVLPPEGNELFQLAANRTVLEGIAAASRGEVLTPETAGRLLDRLAQRVVRREHRDEQRPWQDEPLVWGVLGLFLGLLTLEWVGRKVAGLP
jgi:hypothetical protein